MCRPTRNPREVTRGAQIGRASIKQIADHSTTSDASAAAIPTLGGDAVDPAVADILGRIRPLNLHEAPAIEPTIIDPICAPGDTAIVAGGPGCGKTNLVSDIIVGWGHPQRQNRALGGVLRINSTYSRNQRIAVIDGENTQDRWQTTILRKLKAEKLDVSLFGDVVDYVRPREIGLYDPLSWTRQSENLAQALAERNVALVVVDTLGRMWSPEDPNRADWVQQAFSPFRSACQELDISVIALAHTRRSQGRNDPGPVGPIGSTMQEAQADTLILMDMVKGGTGCRLRLQKCRRAPWIRPGSPICFKFTDGFGYEPQDDPQSAWPLDPSICVTEVASVAPVRARLVTIIRESPARDYKAAELAEMLSCSRHHVTNQLKSLGGCVAKSGQGPATTWRWRG